MFLPDRLLAALRSRQFGPFRSGEVVTVPSGRSVSQAGHGNWIQEADGSNATRYHPGYVVPPGVTAVRIEAESSDWLAQSAA